jgi:hypothetical protein
MMLINLNKSGKNKNMLLKIYLTIHSLLEIKKLKEVVSLKLPIDNPNTTPSNYVDYAQSMV